MQIAHSTSYYQVCEISLTGFLAGVALLPNLPGAALSLLSCLTHKQYVLSSGVT